ncbi:hypothetical protein [Carnimonas bestiolae]|uniref:hypothetical protein n=1 Tax=Carnimonas bestiolae TaxID=3402172 RepID=UPI003EDC60BA
MNDKSAFIPASRRSDAQQAPSQQAEDTFTSVEEVTVVEGLVAVVGCDGTGKSTLTRDLVARLQQQRPTAWRYLGLVSGESGDKIKKLPLIGTWLERRLAAKTAKVQNLHTRRPSWLAVLVMYGFSKWRARNLEKVCRLAESGVLVIADRYPQAQTEGFRFDGPGIGINRVPQGWKRRMAEREHRIYQQLEKIQPSLIIRLDIDLDTAYARKPDHDAEELKEKISVMSQLNYNGARIIDLDARAAYDDVIAGALEAIQRFAPVEHNKGRLR